MINDAQVKGLLKLMSSGMPLISASMKSGMRENTGAVARCPVKTARNIHGEHELIHLRKSGILRLNHFWN